MITTPELHAALHCMARCDECSAISIPSPKRPARVWPTYSALEASAEAGCDVCGLCRYYLANRYRRQSLRDTSGEVQLHADDASWQLSHKGLQGGLYLDVEKSDDDSEVDRTVRGCGAGWTVQRFKQAREWLLRCLGTHKHCDQDGWANDWTPESTWLRRLPKRLVDVSGTDEVKILNCREWIEADLISVDELTDYCTLSYRWGPTAHSCTLAEPFDLMKEVGVHDMPQTFQDGIRVARELGLRFIWIDALCIVQPTEADESDWVEESVRMGTIYENAVFTIAATCAQHAYEGFLQQVGASFFDATTCEFERAPLTGDEKPSAERIRVSPRAPDFFQIVSISLLNARGWVMQERALSKRILHFTEQGLLWECAMAKAHEHWGNYDTGREFGPCRQRESMMSIARARMTQHLCPVEWFHFAKQYSWAKFTNPADRPVALSSVARAVQPLLNDEYLAGIWKKDLIRGLEWRSFSPMKESKDVNIPSWSWVSVGSSVEFTALRLNVLRQKLVKVIDYHMEPLPGMDVYGKLHEGRLRLRGTLATCSLSLVNEWTEGNELFWDELHQDCSDETTEETPVTEQRLEPSAVEAKTVTLPDASVTKPFRSFTLLPFAMGARGSTGGRTDVGCIILEPVGATETNSRGIVVSIEGKYRRLGWQVSSGFLLMANAGEQKRRYLRDFLLSSLNHKTMDEFQKSWMGLDPTIITLI